MNKGAYILLVASSIPPITALSTVAVKLFHVPWLLDWGLCAVFGAVYGFVGAMLIERWRERRTA